MEPKTEVPVMLLVSKDDIERLERIAAQWSKGFQKFTWQEAAEAIAKNSFRDRLERYDMQEVANA